MCSTSRSTVYSPTTVPSYRTTMGCCCETASPDLRSSCTNAFSYTFSRNPVPSAWSTVRAQPMIRLDRRLILPSPISICVFFVFCGSIFLVYCRHNLSNSLTPAKVTIVRRLQSRRPHGLGLVETKHAEENSPVPVQPIGRRRADLAGNDRAVERGQLVEAHQRGNFQPSPAGRGD